MKLLIAADSITIKNIKKILETEPNKKIVGIAKNGQETLEQAEQLQPDLIIIDLEIDGIAATKIITKKHPKIKIIILSCSSNQLNMAISAGAKGFLVRGTPEEDFIAAIDAVMKAETVDMSQENSNEKIATEQFSFIEKWNYLLAAEIINFWLVNQKERIDLKECLKALGIIIKFDKFFKECTDENGFEFEYIKLLKKGNLENVDLFEELRKKLEYLFENLPLNIDSLKYIEREIYEWYDHNKLLNEYNTCSVNLKNKFQIFKKDLNKKLHHLVNYFCHKISIKDSLAALRKIEIFLRNFIEIYEEKKEECIIKQRGCLKVYNERVSAISSCEEELDWDYEIAKKALLNLYNFKLKTEIYSGAIQALEMIIWLNQLYIDDLSNAYEFLTQIKNNFLSKTNKSVYPFLPVLFEQMSEEINLDDLRKEMEQELGQYLQKWGTHGGISVEEVQNNILKKLNPITTKICSQIYDQLNQEFKREDFKNSTFNQVSTEIKAS